MKSKDVLQIVGWLEQAKIPLWLDGGWGVDALVGQQTRPHSDLDIIRLLHKHFNLPLPKEYVDYL